MSKPPFEEMKKCRACGGAKLIEYLNLTDQPLANNLLTTQDDQARYPLRAMLCKTCYHSQLSIVVDPVILYEHYLYVSGTGKTIHEYFEFFAEWTRDIYSSANGVNPENVLDIACNDGSQLDAYTKLGIETYGVDPAENIVPIAIAKGHNITCGFWGKVPTHRAYDIITAQNVFAHTDDVVSFLRACKESMHDHSLLFIQTSQSEMVVNNEFDTMYCVKPNTCILGSNKAISEYQVGDIVWNKDGEFSTTISPMVREYDGIIRKLIPKYLDAIELTTEHPVYIIRRNEIKTPSGQFRKPFPLEFTPEWVLSKDVEVGDYVVIPKLKQNHNLSPTLDLTSYHSTSSHRVGKYTGKDSITLTPNIAWLFGLYTGDGYHSGPNITIALNNTEVDTLGKKLVDIVTNELQQKVWSLDRTKYGSKCTTYIFTCASLSRALVDWFGENAKNKNIPTFILQSSDEIKIQYLRGLIDSDGFVRGNQINYRTSSPVLARQVQLLAASVGVMFGISRVAEQIGHIKNTNQVVYGSESWILRATSRIACNIFGVEYIEKSREPMRNYIDIGNYIACQVVEIEDEHYIGPVHNIQTSDNTYLVSNAVVHNCEHLSFFNTRSMQKLAERCGMHLEAVHKTSMHGTSYVFILSLRGDLMRSNTVTQELESERSNGLYNVATYKKFAENAKTCVTNFKNGVTGWRDKGYKVIGYGAAAKGMTVLNFGDIKLDYIVDDSPLKQGRFAPGVNTPIVSSDVLAAETTDKIVIVPLAWNFTTEIASRVAELTGRTHTFIRYFPEYSEFEL